MRIIQLTDCHVAADPQAGYRGVDARANLGHLLDRVRVWAPDVVLATGDLSEDGSAASYAWLAAAMAPLEVPVLALPGNHDDPAVMHGHFDAVAAGPPLVRTFGDWQMVLLNSAVEGEVAGRLGREQLRLLDRALAACALPKLVALHHQPLPAGSPWIDRYPLLESEALWAVLERYPSVKAVTWGHVHQATEQRRGEVRALGSPSTACNTLPGTEAFTNDPRGPACRWFELQADGGLETGILGLGAVSPTAAGRSTG